MSFLRITIISVAVFLMAIITSFAIYKNQEKGTTILLESGLTRTEITKILGEKLGWDDSERGSFASTYTQMQWAEFNSDLVNILSEDYNWGDTEREIFLINSAKYIDPKLDILSTAYVPGEYIIPEDSSLAEISGILISHLKSEEETSRGYLSANINKDAVSGMVQFVKSEKELLPDIVPVPARDIKIDRIADGRVLLSFTTMYYNKGRGPLELIADPKTKGIRDDIERDVFQRIYNIDGSYRDKLVGNFFWHQPHLHYHYEDFITYDLEAVDARDHPDLSGVKVKSTFCVRDVSLVKIEVENRPEDAQYLICGKELQGISVGWADTYFYNYPDQNLNISDLSSGIYRLSFFVNPDNRFDEINYINNISSVVIKINMEKLEVEILSEEPENSPDVDHIYPEQVFNN